jgi:hypothetical protein
MSLADQYVCKEKRPAGRFFYAISVSAATSGCIACKNVPAGKRI